MDVINYKIPDTLLRSIFRANDIRGNVHTELTPDVVYAIGLALGGEINHAKQKKIIVARDGRLSSEKLSQALAQGLMHGGFDVIDIGAVPTPLLYFATNVLETSSGIMMTGSHNPSDDNGLKIVLEGQILSEDKIAAIYNRILKKEFQSGNGKLEFIEIIPTYFSHVLNDIKLKRKLRVVIDCGNGIVGNVFPSLAKKLGCDVIELFCEVDGTFPNHFPDPSVPANLNDLIRSVRENKAEIGIAFDGDGDRLGMVTDQGKIIWADRQLMLFSKNVLKNNSGATIIYDVKCTSLLTPWIKKYHGNPLMWKTGHSFIKSKMHETHAKLAGEMSGHFYFADRWFGFDDGLYAAARLFEILSESTETIDHIFSEIPNSINTPELRAAIPDNKKFQFMDALEKRGVFREGKMTSIDGIRVDYDFGFGLIRASNTTPCLILRFEADTNENLHKIQEIFRKQILSIEPTLPLPF